MLCYKKILDKKHLFYYPKLKKEFGQEKAYILDVLLKSECKEWVRFYISDVKSSLNLSDKDLNKLERELVEDYIIEIGESTRKYRTYRLTKKASTTKWIKKFTLKKRTCCIR